MTHRAPATLPRSQKLRLGLYGGSFDPIHLGHLMLAIEVGELAALDQVILIPAKQSPHKQSLPGLTAAERWQLVQSSIADFPTLSAWKGELERESPSYSVDTARWWFQQRADAELFWIIGADQVGALPHWHRIGDMAQFVTFLAMTRASMPLEPPSKIPGLRLEPVATRRVDLSSSEIRERLAQRKPVRHLLPRVVAEYLEKRTAGSKHGYAAGLGGQSGQRP